MKKSILYYVAMIFIFIGILIYLVLMFHPAFNDFSFRFDSQSASVLGNTIAGLVGPLLSLAGIILVIETLKSQNYNFAIQKFESQFFELIKIHRENVNNLKKLSPSGANWSGPQVFEDIYNELKWTISNINSLCENTSLRFTANEKGGLAFTILFFGVSQSSENVLREYFSRHYSFLPDEAVDNLIHYCKIQKSNNPDNIHRFVGHQTRLGHYYRHLYQTVKFVHNYNILSKEEKYNYLKILRAQLTTYEQTLLFFNSLSVLGKNWNKSPENYITTYKLIKNLPPEFTFGISPKEIYPSIIFEYEE